MRRSIILGLSLFVAGCGPRVEDTAPEVGREDTDVDTLACSEDTECGDGEICEEDACVDGDRDNSVEEATALLWGADFTAEGVLNPAGDVDWYAVEAEGGEFFRASVVTAEADDGIDTVLSIYTSAGKRLAWEDEHPGGGISGIDSAVYAYFPEAGTYYLAVEDNGTFYEEEEPVGGPDQAYTLTILDLGGGGLEADSLLEPGVEYDSITTNTWYSIPVLISDAGDVDYASLVLPEAGAPTFFLAGVHNEESELAPALTVTNAAGDVVNTFAGPTAEAPAYLPGPVGTRYTVAVGDDNGGFGADYWGWMFFILRDVGTGNQSAAEPNEDLAGAEVVDLEPHDDDTDAWVAAYRQGYVDLGDADVFAFTTPSEGYVTLSLGAQAYGSQLVARVELLDSSGAVLDAADSSDGVDESMRDRGPYPAGDYYLRITSTDPGVGGEGHYYLFGLHATTVPFD